MFRNVRVLSTVLAFSAGCRSAKDAKLQDEGLEQSLSQIAQDAPATRSLSIFNDDGNIRIVQLTFGRGDIGKRQVASVMSKLENFKSYSETIDLETIKSVFTDELFADVKDIVDGILMPQNGPLTSAVGSPALVDPSKQALVSLQTILNRLAAGETSTRAEAMAPVDQYVGLVDKDISEAYPNAYRLSDEQLWVDTHAPATFHKSDASLLTDVVFAANALKQIYADGPVAEAVQVENVRDAIAFKKFLYNARFRANQGDAGYARSALVDAYNRIDRIASRSKVMARADANLIESLIDSKTHQARYNQYMLNFEPPSSTALLAFRSSQAQADSVGAVAAERGWTFKIGQKRTWREWLSWRFNSRIPRDVHMSAAQYLTLVKFAAAINDLNDPRAKPLLDFLAFKIGRSPAADSKISAQSPMEVKDESIDVANVPILEHIDIDGTEIADTVNLPDEPAPNGTEVAATVADEDRSAAGDSPDASANATPADADSSNADSARPGTPRR